MKQLKTRRWAARLGAAFTLAGAGILVPAMAGSAMLEKISADPLRATPEDRAFNNTLNAFLHGGMGDPDEVTDEIYDSYYDAELDRQELVDTLCFLQSVESRQYAAAAVFALCLAAAASSYKSFGYSNHIRRLTPPKIEAAPQELANAIAGDSAAHLEPHV